MNTIEDDVIWVEGAQVSFFRKMDKNLLTKPKCALIVFSKKFLPGGVYQEKQDIQFLRSV